MFTAAALRAYRPTDVRRESLASFTIPQHSGLVSEQTTIQLVW